MIKRLNIYYWLRKIFVSRFAQKYLNQNFIRKFIFFLIYKTNHWNKYEKVDKNNLLVSGPGSIQGSLQTKNIIDNLDTFIKKNNIQSMLDMACGDFSWMQDLIKKNNYINYTGYDIVEDIISYNNKKYSKNNVSFFCKDIINEKNFDNFDLVFIRDFFIHIDNASINVLLKNIKNSKVRFLACSNNNNELNKDVVVGQHRNVNLKIKPFYMKEIFHTFSEGVDGCSINIYKIS
jgi:2-polyprenyl-3-methyl-5-hydroxy-6-metoxy-1,4-benzoquinol methylase